MGFPLKVLSLSFPSYSPIYPYPLYPLSLTPFYSLLSVVPPLNFFTLTTRGEAAPEPTPISARPLPKWTS